MDAAHDAADRLLELARRSGEPDKLLVAETASGMAEFHGGDLPSALEHLERGIALYNPSEHASLAFSYMLEFGVNNRFHAGIALFARGYPDRAWAMVESAVALARERQPVNVSAALAFGGQVAIWRRDAEKARAWADDCIALSNEHGFVQQRAFAKASLGWALAEAGNFRDALVLIEQGVDFFRSAGAGIQLTRQLCVLAEVLLAADQGTEASDVAAEALELSRQTGERRLRAELTRISGDTLLAAPASDNHAAETSYLEAIEIARAQSARSWELRAATRLARLWQSQGKTAEARDLLAPIHGWFTEGLDTPDLVDAKALLDELA